MWQKVFSKEFREDLFNILVRYDHSLSFRSQYIQWGRTDLFDDDGVAILQFRDYLPYVVAVGLTICVAAYVYLNLIDDLVTFVNDESFRISKSTVDSNSGLGCDSYPFRPIIRNGDGVVLDARSAT